MPEDIKISVEEMNQAGVNFGHRVSKLHPKMQPFILGVKNTVHVIDLEKTVEKLREALKFISTIAAERKTILFVGTKIQTRDIVRQTATECAMPYVTERWLGGTFTNLETILKRINYFKSLEQQKASGELEKYTKKERLNIDKELAILKTKFEGIRDMSKLPDAVFILDISKDDACLKEAKIKKIKTIALCDTNTNPGLVDYPIPANDDAISSVKYILEKIKWSLLNK